MVQREDEGENSVQDDRLDALYKAASQALTNGQRDHATELLGELLALNPREVRAHFMMGNLHLKSGDQQQALRCYDTALTIDSEYLPAKLNRANTLLRLEQFQEAETAYRAVLEIRPDLSVAWFNLGLLLKHQGQLDQAVISLQQAVERDNNLEKGFRLLADTLSELRRYKEAAAALKSLQKIVPEDFELLKEQGILHKKAGNFGLAEKAYRSALVLNPLNAELHYNLGSAVQEQSKYLEAVKCFRAALQIEPERAEIFVSLGNCLHQTGDIEGALENYRSALEINSGLAHARFAYCISQLPIVYRSEHQITECRANYAQKLKELHDYYFAADTEERRLASKAVGFLQPFYLAYQGLSVRDLQQQYGRTIRMLMAARYPEYDKVIGMPATEGKIRLGIVSGFLRNHSAWNHFQGLFEALDRRKFEIILFSTRTEPDRVTQLLESLSDGIVHGPKDTKEWAQVIRGQNLHVLLYPEFGMDPMGIRLGCLRLAPIQLTCWGHPVTSGLDTIDYFLSSDLMEPENGQDEYTEKLVRLPNLGMHYRLPTVDPAPLTREDLGLPENGVMYWCCQSLFKYLPRHDDVFPLIAKRLKEAFFVFLEGHGGEVKELIRQRLEASFTAHGLRMTDHCHFLPRMPKPSFAAVTVLANVFLDSCDWSGCNSSMEAIAVDRPILTLPGNFMRGRHTSAFLQMMGMEEWIAESKDEFITMAVRLGQDATLRKSVSESISRNKHRLYRDPKPVRMLEDFLQKAVSDYGPKAPETSEAIGVLYHLQRKCEESPEDSSKHWDLACHYQKLENFDSAAREFCRSLDLENPIYSAHAPAPAPPLLREASHDNGYIEVAGLRYPRIPSITEDASRPFWSVVVPAFNRESYLLQCLASVLAQYRGQDHMEIIVIDNGSDPWLKNHVDSLGKGIVRYHRHNETIPLQRNWNSAVNASTGRWIHLLHDDDYVLPGFYRALEKALASSPDTVGAAFTAYENINQHDEVVFRNQVLGSQRGVIHGWERIIGVSNVLNPPAVVVRRKAYEEIGGYSDEILYTTDWELYMRLVSYFDWLYEPQILARYRVHPMNITTEQSMAGTQGEAFWKAIERAEKYLPESSRRNTVKRSRRYHFRWALQRLRLPLQAENPEGSFTLLREMLRIDRSNESLQELFDWLGTSMAEPLWPAIMEVIDELPDKHFVPSLGSTGLLFNWLCSAGAADVRMEISRILAQN